jgi:hypothetical protein
MELKTHRIKGNIKACKVIKLGTLQRQEGELSGN